LVHLFCTLIGVVHYILAVC